MTVWVMKINTRVPAQPPWPCVLKWKRAVVVSLPSPQPRLPPSMRGGVGETMLSEVWDCFSFLEKDPEKWSLVKQTKPVCGSYPPRFPYPFPLLPLRLSKYFLVAPFCQVSHWRTAQGLSNQEAPLGTTSIYHVQQEMFMGHFSPVLLTLLLKAQQPPE